jgi:hypothetical protein
MDADDVRRGRDIIQQARREGNRVAEEATRIGLSFEFPKEVEGFQEAFKENMRRALEVCYPTAPAEFRRQAAELSVRPLSAAERCPMDLLVRIPDVSPFLCSWFAIATKMLPYAPGDA